MAMRAAHLLSGFLDDPRNCRKFKLLRPAKVAACGCAGLFLAIASVAAQQPGLQPGEAFVTRFSGITQAAGPNGQQIPVINPNGTSGSIIDLRAPGFPPMGIHWMTEPQSNPVTAAQVGQVFGVVLDDANPPNIYLSATSAFGLHLAPGTTRWMQGMWGQNGGPGTIYRLDAANNYRPSVFANVTLNNRQNTGAALGNMAFDKANHQIFVSDLETGMITRIRANGAILDSYDHGTQGRPKFMDMSSRQQLSLPAIAFNRSSAAQIQNCPSGAFTSSPECWNYAASGRRVWGLAVRRDPATGDQRLYYAVMSSPAFGNSGWNSLPEDQKRNSVWSVHIAPGGAFDVSDVRREILLPDFFTETQDVARAGYSSPISDIAFSECSATPVMLIAERGMVRNLGLGADDAFAYPHEARALRYQLGQGGTWEAIGRYDVGFYDRKGDLPPYVHANCSGGAAFGYGYSGDYSAVDQTQPEQYVWITADSLCSPAAPCFLPQGSQAGGQQASGDPSAVHGLAGLPAIATDPMMPPSAVRPYPPSGPPYPSVGPQVSYLIDTDVDVDASGQAIEAEFVRNDATKIGDVAVYEICPAGAPAAAPVAMVPSAPLVMPEVTPSIPVPILPVPVGPPVVVVHVPIGSVIHMPPGSVITPPGGGPPPPGGHEVIASIIVNHTPALSNIHVPIGSTVTHSIAQSVVVNHTPALSQIGNHDPIVSQGHVPALSSLHLPAGSTSTHSLVQSVIVNHQPALSSLHMPVGSTVTHTIAQSVVVNHTPAISQVVVHNPIVSQNHLAALSSLHLPAGSTNTHSLAQSVVVNHQPALSSLHVPAGSTVTHTIAQSVVVNHTPAISQVVIHEPLQSQVQNHQPALSTLHLPVGSTVTHTVIESSVVNHTAAISALNIHDAAQSAVGTHSPSASAAVHDASQSLIINHSVALSAVHQPPGSTVTHDATQSQVINHSPALSSAHVPAGSTSTHSLAQSTITVHSQAASATVHDATQSALANHTAAASSIHVPVGSTNAHSVALSGVVIHPQGATGTGGGGGGGSGTGGSPGSGSGGAGSGGAGSTSNQTGPARTPSGSGLFIRH